MILSESFKTYICALSSSNDHLVQEPLCLDCNHQVCSKCINYETSKDVFCKYCEKNCNLCKQNESLLLLDHIDELFNMIGENFRIKIEQLKESYKSHIENIDLKIEFLKDEIEVRVDSLKTKIDRLHEELIDNLMIYRENFLKQKEEKYQISCFEDDYNNKMVKTEENLLKYQKKLSEMDNILSSNSIGDYQFVFNYDFFPETRTIGQISFKANCKLVNKIKSNNLKLIDLDYEVTDMLFLPNGNLALFSWETGQVMIMNKEFKVIEVIEELNGKTFNPMSVCTNGKDRIYMGDYYNRQIIMTDFNFNFIKYSNILSTDLSSYPRGLCFNDNFIYVCDQSTNRIHRFDSELETHHSFAIDIKPKQIKISGNIACVSSLSTYVCFYDTKTFNLIEKYIGHGGNIFELNGNFYEYSNKQKILFIYDENGIIIEEIKNLEISNFIKDDSFHGIVYHNGKIIFSSGYSKKLIIFD